MKPRFVLPPHPNPHMRIRRVDLPTYENTGQYLAQRKFNGTHTVIWIWQDQIMMWDRRGIPLTLYKLTDGMRQCLTELRRDSSKETILVGEILHSKAKSKITNEQEAKDTIVLFDAIMRDGEFLVKYNQQERLQVLAEICNNPTQLEPPKFFGATSRALVVRDQKEAHLWLAETFFEDFSYHFDECCLDQCDKKGNDKYEEIEGLMLRRKESSFQIGANGIGDVDWLIRCRKREEKKYMF